MSKTTQTQTVTDLLAIARKNLNEATPLPCTQLQLCPQRAELGLMAYAKAFELSISDQADLTTFKEGFGKHVKTGLDSKNAETLASPTAIRLIDGDPAFQGLPGVVASMEKKAGVYYLHNQPAVKGAAAKTEVSPITLSGAKAEVTALKKDFLKLSPLKFLAKAQAIGAPDLGR